MMKVQSKFLSVVQQESESGDASVVWLTFDGLP